MCIAYIRCTLFQARSNCIVYPSNVHKMNRTNKQQKEKKKKLNTGNVACDKSHIKQILEYNLRKHVLIRWNPNLNSLIKSPRVTKYRPQNDRPNACHQLLLTPSVLHALAHTHACCALFLSVSLSLILYSHSP